VAATMKSTQCCDLRQIKASWKFSATDTECPDWQNIKYPRSQLRLKALDESHPRGNAKPAIIQKHEIANMKNSKFRKTDLLQVSTPKNGAHLISTIPQEKNYPREIT
jgi:hypothetical protein